MSLNVLPRSKFNQVSIGHQKLKISEFSKFQSTISADSTEKNLMGAINNIQTKLSLIEPSDYTHIDTRLQVNLKLVLVFPPNTALHRQGITCTEFFPSLFFLWRSHKKNKYRWFKVVRFGGGGVDR